MPKAKPKKKAAARRPAASANTTRRSPCPVACALDLFGDRWTLLIVRDLVLGRSRFKDFTAAPEGIPTNILTERLARLLAGGIVQQNPATDGGKRMAYELTAKGRALLPVLKAIRDWGLRWEEGTQAMPVPSKKRLATVR